MKQLVGKVTIEEKNEIHQLFERKNGLVELTKVVDPDNEKMYNKLVTDMGRTQHAFQAWWDTMNVKYKWSGSPTGHWEIDFQTCEIYLVD